MWTFNTVKSIRFAPGLLKYLGSEMKSANYKRVLLVTDPGMVQNTNIITRAQKYLKASGIDVLVFDKVQADPPESIVHEATEIAKDFKANSIIGLGGGSSLDVAKLVAVLALEQEKLEDIYGVGNVQGGRLPLTLIPTTAGTGSEVTQVSIVTTGATTKMGVVSPVLLPDIAIMDPELTYDLPAHITAATGIDAIVHAIEAYTSANPNNNPISRNLAIAALQKMIPVIERAVSCGSDDNDSSSISKEAARSDMMLGSMWAGQAFANSPVAAVHALAYPIGGHYKVSHGLSNTLILPHVLRFNAEKFPELYAELAALAFPATQSQPQSHSESAMQFIEELVQLSKMCGLEQSLRDVNIEHGALPLLASEAMKQQRLLVNNPRILNEKDILGIYQAAW
jgi:alcohol dehydrogenase class IV